MTTAQIIERTKALLDEYSPSGSGLLVGTIEDKPIDAYIQSSLNASWVEFAKSAPLHLLPKATATSVTMATAGVGAINVPSDYLRTINFKLTSWTINAFPITIDNPLYQLQKNEYTRGTATRPVAVIDGSVIYAFVGLSGDIIGLSYVPMLDFSDTGDIMSDRIGEPFCCNVAANVYLAMKDFNSAKGMMEKMAAML